VLEGLSAEDGVVVDGTLNLRDGVQVKVQGGESLDTGGHANAET